MTIHRFLVYPPVTEIQVAPGITVPVHPYDDNWLAVLDDSIPAQAEAAELLYRRLMERTWTGAPALQGVTVFGEPIPVAEDNDSASRPRPEQRVEGPIDSGLPRGRYRDPEADDRVTVYTADGTTTLYVEKDLTETKELPDGRVVDARPEKKAQAWKKARRGEVGDRPGPDGA